jgi:hypothetical protein
MQTRPRHLRLAFILSALIVPGCATVADWFFAMSDRQHEAVDRAVGEGASLRNQAEGAAAHQEIDRLY